MTERAADKTADQTAARTALAGLRPQPFGCGNPQRIVDPIVEPMWWGIRVLAGIDGPEVTLADEAGETLHGHGEIAAALADAAEADRLVVDGFLTRLTDHGGSGVYEPPDDLPTTRQLASRSLLGRAFGPEDEVTFIAIDLLWVDGESLLDVPLLERRRLLESVLAESDLVRRGVFVRPPIEAWIGSWRALGFTELSFKSANGRYRPGEATDDWVSVPMPRR